MDQNLLALLAAAFVLATVFLLIMASFWRGENPVRARVDSLVLGTNREDLPDLARPLAERVLGPAVDAVADRILAILPQSILDGLKKKLILAGEHLNLGGFLTVMATAGGLFLALAFALVVAAGGGFQTTQLLLLVALGGLGLALPYLWLINRVRRRQAIITKSLPDSFDLITTCVEAGLGLDAALARVAEKVQGPFAEELSRTLREVGMGRMRRDALRELGERIGVPDLITFVNAVIQAEQMGTGIGQVLRIQSEQLRVRRRQRAEESANQAPVKMVFPLVFCIFPTLFLVILGPAGISIYQNFSK
jgi:tight adherence protein C